MTQLGFTYLSQLIHRLYVSPYGNHFGRFTPYSNLCEHQHEFIYPRLSFYDEKLKESLAEKYQSGSGLDIDAIEPQTVFNCFLYLQKTVYG